MSTWSMTVLLQPRGGANGVGFMRTIVVYASPAAEADDVVGDAEAACLLRWPGMHLLRVYDCVAQERGDEVQPSRRREM